MNVDDIPIETLDLNVDIEVPKGLDGLASSDRYYLEAKRAEKSKKKSRRYDSMWNETKSFIHSSRLYKRSLGKKCFSLQMHLPLQTLISGNKVNIHIQENR